MLSNPYVRTSTCSCLLGRVRSGKMALRLMADFPAPPDAKRSRNMAAIRSQNTRIELYVRRALHGAGIRFRLHRKDLTGKPDIVLPRFRTVVLVHGCYFRRPLQIRFEARKTLFV